MFLDLSESTIAATDRRGMIALKPCLSALPMNPTQNRTEQFWAYYRKRQVEPSDATRLRDRLIADNQQLARKYAHRFSRNSREPYEDLEALAMIGLQKAIERFDPTRGAQFSSFAVPYINGEMLHAIRDWRNGIRINRRHAQIHSQVRRYHRDMIAIGREMSLEQIAGKLGYSPEYWAEIVEEIEQPVMLSLSSEGLVDRSTGDVAPLDVAFEADETIAIPENLEELVGQLKQPYRDCIVERFWGGMELDQIATKHQVTVGQVESWLQDSLNILKDRIEVEAWPN
jgi:RNA polymerase sigma-B factor